jgi:hypothetical protein
MADDELTPEIFKGLRLDPTEQAKGDVLKANWKRLGNKAMDDFMEAEPKLMLKALDHACGDEAVRDALEQAMNKRGMTRADLKRKPH